MPVLTSTVDTLSPAFAQQRARMLELVAQLRAIEGQARAEEERKRDRFRARQQLLPRERVHRLLDPASPWLELQTLAGYQLFDDTDGALAGGNTISGIGYVEGVRCLINASNSAIKGGTLTPATVQKALRLQEIALRQKLPLLSLIESGGANLLYQVDSFVPGGRTFANQARLSAAGIPQITVVHGSSTAGGAYMPGLSDYVVMVRGKAKVFLAGPPLLRAATGEIASDEELGGAEMHAQVAGTSEFLAEDDADAIRLARALVRQLDWHRDLPALPAEVTPPLHDPQELCGAVPPDHRTPYDPREVIARLADGSEFLDFKAEFDRQMVCGWSRIAGFPVGFLANQGPITAHGANKATQFIQLCCQSDTALVFLMNTTGYMVGTAAEQGGIVKHGSKMLQAVANASVPRLTLVIGGSFGAGNYGMSGRGLDPDFIFAWPNARTAVMGGEQAARVLTLVAREKWRRDGKTPSADEEAQLVAAESQLIAQFEAQSSAFAASARLFDDGIIDPRDSRKVLAYTLSICHEARRRSLRPSSFGVARP